MDSELDVSSWLPALARFVEPACQAIGEKRIQGAIDVNYAEILPALKTELVLRLLMHARRTLVLELNVARLCETLQGETSKERFSYFIERLHSQPEAWAAILEEYPILAERLHTEVQRFVANVTETLAALGRDWEAITQTFAEAPSRARLVTLSCGLSDGHRGGRSVAKLGLQGDGRSFQLLYKPKAMAVDVHFQNLLARCNAAAQSGALHLEALRHARLRAKSAFPKFYLQRILDRGDYGWVEFIATKECESQAEIDRFYLRQGGFLALLHLLHGTDVHFENLIACGEHPVLIDLETLFHQPFRHRSYAADATARIEQILETSVLRTGLLPGRAWADGAQPGVNIGGLGNDEIHTIPLLTAGFEDAETDEMKAAPRPSFMPLARNLPRLHGQIAPAAHHVEEIVAGFEAMLRFVRAQQNEWLVPGGPLDSFATDEVRQVVRATTVYAKLLALGTHPDYLRSAEEREQALAMLAEADELVPKELVHAELADLRSGDVPFFTARPSSRSLWDSTGQEHKEHFALDCLTAVRSSLETLDDREIARQIFLVRAGLSASAFGAATELQHCTASTEFSARDAAVQLGELLLDTAIFAPDDVSWIGMKFTGEAACTVAAVDGDLYDGRAGITLFLSYLAAITREPRFQDLAMTAARAVRRSLHIASEKKEYGGFVGLPSQLYALSHAAVILQEPQLVAGLSTVQAQLAAIAESPQPIQCDVIYGAAGCILALLSLHTATGAKEPLATAVAFGRRLVQAAVPGPYGLAFSSHAGVRPLLGFAHGAAGIYCALLRLATATMTHLEFGAVAREFSKAADGALQYERAHFDSALQNWPDLRSEPARFMTTWCHGAPGVLLSRVATGAATADAMARSEVETAVATTLRQEHSEHSLCHGAVGNLLIVAQAAQLLQRHDWQKQVASRLEALLAELRTSSPRCGFAFPQAVPSLMTGISGVGYGLLALSVPGGLPCVLSLDPPRQH